MTISILAYDENTGACGGAATTGNLCVGGWVLRGDAESGLSASQGSLPSTLWGEDVLALLRAGTPAQAAVEAVTRGDPGRDERQLAVLDRNGVTASFTGKASIPAAGAREAPNVIVTGNLLTSEGVLDACLHGFLGSDHSLDLRLMAALDAAAQSGGDSRGLMSAALLVVAPHAAPVSLRIDQAERPLAALRALHRKATTGTYARWLTHVPTLDDPYKATPYVEKTDQPV